MTRSLCNFRIAWPVIIIQLLGICADLLILSPDIHQCYAVSHRYHCFKCFFLQPALQALVIVVFPAYLPPYSLLVCRSLTTSYLRQLIYFPDHRPEKYHLCLQSIILLVNKKITRLFYFKCGMMHTEVYAKNTKNRCLIKSGSFFYYPKKAHIVWFFRLFSRSRWPILSYSKSPEQKAGK